MDDETKRGEGNGSSEGDPVVRWILNCRKEAKEAKWQRIQQTRENWDIYWMRQDFSHKLPGQSTEALSMQAMAVEETAAFFQQALADMGDEWYSVDSRNPTMASQMKITPDMVKSLVGMQLEKAEILKHVSNGIKSGLMGAKIITKVHGDQYCVPKYVATRSKDKREAKLEKQEKYAWKLRLDIVSQFNYFPDPTPTNHKPLYEIEDMWMDYHEVVALSRGDDAIYDPDMVDEIESSMDDDSDEKFDQQRRTNQNTTSHAFRGRVKITEFWGTILDDEGEVLHDNVVATIANDRWLIRKPTDNPLWHQESPYVTGNLLDLPDAVWTKALMDSATKHNITATEIFNLMVDGGMRAANGIGMIRQDWLEDPSQIEGGIRPGTNLTVNGSAPPGAKVMEMVQTGTVPADSQQMFNIIQQEFNRAALTSDIRQGIQPRKDVSATQVVETNQTITSVFQGMSKNIETNWMQRILNKAWLTTAQYSDLADEDEIRTVLGEPAEAYLNLTPEERFAETVHGVKFRVNGITLTLQKAQDVRRYQTLLQTIGANEVLMEEFIKQGNSMGLLLQHIMRSMGIDTRAIQMSADEKAVMQGQAAAQQPQAQPGTSPNNMSQVPSPTTGSAQDQLGSAAGPSNQPAGQPQ